MQCVPSDLEWWKASTCQADFCDRRTDWAKVSSDDEDSVDLPADATESALHNALTDMHRSGVNVKPGTGYASDDADTSGMQGDSSSIALSMKAETGWSHR